MNTLKTPPSGDLAEIGSLAVELVHAYREMTAFYRDKMRLTAAEADHRTRGLENTAEQAADDLARIRERSPDQVSWFDLQRLINHDPAAIAPLWSEMKVKAREELASGHRAAQTLEWKGGPWDRARFLAIRDSFREDTPPQNGIEAALIDTVAEAFSDYLGWSEHLHIQIGSEVEAERHQLLHDGGWSPPRHNIAEAIEQSSKMAERAHSRFLRTIKLLNELRRTSPTLYVGTAGQINVGAQQVNVTGPAPEASTSATDLPKS